MDITKLDMNYIKKLIEKKDNGNELEVRFCSNKNCDEDLKLNKYIFDNLFNTLIFKKEYGGYEMKNYEIQTILDIKSDNLRLSIEGEDVKKFWLYSEKNLNEIKHKIIEKKNIDKYDLEEYDIRFSLSKEEETPVSKSSPSETKKNQSFMTDKKKIYRLKRRCHIKTPDNMFYIDLTSVKTAELNNFRQMDIKNINEEYEIEIEYNYESKSKHEEIFDKLFNYINIIAKLLKRNVQKSIKNEIYEKYKELTKINKNYQEILKQPITFHSKNLNPTNDINISSGYGVSPKADGLKCILFILSSDKKEFNGNIYLIDNSLNIIKTKYKLDDWNNTIIECEYISENNMILLYDILFQKGNDIRNLKYIEGNLNRIQYLIEFNKSINKIINQEDKNAIFVEIKEYLYGDIIQDINKIWLNRESYTYKIDGLIFFPLNKTYNDSIILKWKPNEYNSIDFLIEIEKNDDGKDRLYPYIIRNEYGKNDVKQYKKMFLYVGAKSGKDYKPKQFSPYSNDEKNDEVNNANVLLDENDKMLAYDELHNLYTEIYDNMIVEFIYDKNDKLFRWKPVRVRYDKTERYKNGENVFGNDEKIANDNFVAIINEVNFERLTFGFNKNIQDTLIEDVVTYYNTNNAERLPLNNFHNLIKKDLIKQAGGKSLLDLACGKAGDLFKWIKSGYKFIVGIDLNRQNIELAEKFNEKNNNNSDIEINFIPGDTGKLIFPYYESGLDKFAKEKMEKLIPSKYMFDVVSSQFCLHYYFKDENTLRILLQNVNDNLKIGGYFIGTSFDGQRIVDAFTGKKLLQGELNDKLIWKIDKNYNKPIFTSVKSNLGKAIDVFYHTIGKTHEEFLVNYDFLDKMLKEYGFEKVLVKEFGKYYEEFGKDLSDVEKEFSFLNNAFIYKKISNTSDNLFKKIKNVDEKKTKDKK